MTYLNYEVFNKSKRISYDLLDQVILFSCKYLDLEVDLIIEFETLEAHCCGYCDFADGEATITIARRLSKQEFIKTVFHEMVHVKQFSDGRLEGGFHCRWNGELYTAHKYEDLPWEIEAHKLEQLMMKEFENANR